MPTEVILPKVDMDMTHARLVKWHVAEGEPVVAGDLLFEMETDKSVMEVEAEADGTLSRVTGMEGTSIGIGEVIAYILAADEVPLDATPADAPPSAKRATDNPASETPAAEPHVADVPTADIPATKPTATTTTAAETPRATPYARRLARERGVDLSTLQGSARRGRIQSADVPPDTAARPANQQTDLDLFGQVRCLDRQDARHESDRSDSDRVKPATFLLLHGFSADHTSYASLTHTLAGKGHRVLVPDLPGHGQTPAETCHPDDLAKPLAAVLDAAAGEELHIVAHSLGAVPALQLSERYPVRSLTLIAPAGMSSAIHADFIRGIASPASVAELAHLLRLLSAKPDRPDILSPAAVRELFVSLSQGRLTALAEALLGKIGLNVDIVPALQSVAARRPVRVIVGGRDRIIDARAATCLGPNIAVHHFPDAGHLPHWEYPREVLSILERSL